MRCTFHCRLRWSENTNNVDPNWPPRWLPQYIKILALGYPRYLPIGVEPLEASLGEASLGGHSQGETIVIVKRNQPA